MAQRHYRAVVADDDTDVRRLAQRYLERSGRFTIVAEAGDGEEAVTAAREHQPDVTLLDILMPDIDGFEALPRIRSVAPRSRVVVVSGLQRARIEEDALAAGATGFLLKQPSWKQFAKDLLLLLEQDGVGGVSPEDAGHRELRLPGALTSGRDARVFLRETLQAWGLTHLIDDAQLLTTELINNAVVHATSEVILRVRVDSGRLRVEISDSGRGSLHLQSGDLTDDSGRGLFLVDALASTWGAVAGAEAKTVWFELDAAGS